MVVIPIHCSQEKTFVVFPWRNVYLRITRKGGLTSSSGRCIRLHQKLISSAADRTLPRDTIPIFGRLREAQLTQVFHQLYFSWSMFGFDAISNAWSMMQPPMQKSDSPRCESPQVFSSSSEWTQWREWAWPLDAQTLPVWQSNCYNIGILGHLSLLAAQSSHIRYHSMIVGFLCKRSPTDIASFYEILKVILNN